MPRFRFEAMAPAGDACSGHIQAADADTARQLLRQRGVFVVALREVRDTDEDGGTESSLPLESVPSETENSVPLGPRLRPSQPITSPLRDRLKLVGCALSIFAALFLGAAVMYLGVEASEWFRRSTGVSAAILLGGLVGGVPLTIGLTAIGKGVCEWYWPTTVGEITCSRLRERVPWVNRAEWEQAVDNYEAVIRYRYSVGNQKFSGEAPGGAVVLGWKLSNVLFGSESQAAALAAKYPEGSPVTVYYHPRNPAVSVLRPGPNLTAVFLVIFGGLVIGFGVLGGLLPSP